MNDISIRLESLQPIVRKLFGNENAVVTKWQQRAVEGGFSDAFGVYRLEGKAMVAGQERIWSVILKVIGPSSGSHHPTAWNYWKREALVYQSELLQYLPGDLVAPRCLGVEEESTGEFWLWLEDVQESGDADWPLERYGTAARHLGQFNGAYLADKSLPNFPWLAADHFEQRLAEAESGVAQLPQLGRNALFDELSSEESIAHTLRLWDQRHRMLALRARLPVALCHHDVFRHNLIARDDAERFQTVAIDWSTLGPGVIGAEVAHLFAVSLTFVAVELDRIPELDSLIFAGYVDGLRDAGWRGDVRLARFGYTATAVLNGIADRGIKWPRVAERIAALPPGAEVPKLLNPGGPAQSVAKHAYLHVLGDEAIELLDAMD